MHRILVVEESTTLRYILCRNLERHGFEPVPCDGPAAAFAHLDDLSALDLRGIVLGWPMKPGWAAHRLLADLGHADRQRLAVVLLAQDRADALVAWTQERHLSALMPWDDHPNTGATLTRLLGPADTESVHTDRGLRVLLVDDSPSVRFFYHRLLSRAGYDVEPCPDAATAYRLAARGDFDLAVVDYFLPGETGDRLCARLMADPRTAHMKVAVLTGVYNDGVIRDCLDAGAVECLFKHESESLFLARIGALWRSILAHKAVEAARSRLAAILASAGDGVYGVDPRGLITFINPAACHILGIADPAEVLGQSAHVLFHGLSREGRPLSPERCPLSQAYARGECLPSWEAVFRHRSGRLIPVQGSIQPLLQSYGEPGSVVAFQDVSERKAMEAQLQWQAEHDDLTGLYNRRYLERALEAEQARCHSTGERSALLLLNLDRFKYVNDTAGHVVGDSLLVEVSRYLKTCLGDAPVLARPGGDEFAVILSRPGEENLRRVGEALRRLFHERRFHVAGGDYRLDLSIGVAWLGCPGETAADVLANADVACHLAKQSGRNQLHVYEPDRDLRAFMGRDLACVDRLRDALEKDRFRLHFQPIVPAAGVGSSREQYEVLLRLDGDRGELTLPGDFIPVAEHFGMMPEIDLRVVGQAVRDLGCLRAAGRDVVFNLNLSGRTLSDPDTLCGIRRVLETSGTDLAALVFEITETSAILNLSAARDFIDALRLQGARFALDDFGTGFCSLSHLKQLPVDIVKFDGQFVRDLHRDAADRAMVAAMNDIVHAMGLDSVAEYVECDEVLQCLRGLGVDYVQGNYLGRPTAIPCIGGIGDPSPEVLNSRSALLDAGR